MNVSDSVDDARPCPMCGYAMCGLPDVHRCPECGFECDPLTVVFRLGPGTGSPYSICFGLAALLMFLSARTGRIFAVNVAIAGLLAVGLISPLFRKERRERFTSALVIDRTGVHADDADRRIWEYTWPQIARAHYSGVTGALTIYDDRGVKLLTMSGRSFGVTRMSKRCAAEINRLRVVYSGDANAR